MSSKKINAPKSKFHRSLNAWKKTIISANTSIHFLSDKNSFSEKLCVSYETPCRASGLLVFSLTHVTCIALHHTVVIRYSTSGAYGTLCHVSDHLVIYSEYYGFERESFLLSGVFLPSTPSCFFKASLRLVVHPQS